MSERALIFAPRGRDAIIAGVILTEAGLMCETVASFNVLASELRAGAGFALVAEEAVDDFDVKEFLVWRDSQPSWSDFPFILLTKRGGTERNPAAGRYLELLGNVTFLERPFHPTTLVALAKTALRGRKRQYVAQSHLEALHNSEERFRAAVDAVQGVLWTNSGEGRMQGIQPGWSALTGQSQAEYEGYGWSNTVHPDDKQPTVDAWNEAVRTKTQFRFEHRVRRYDGEWRHFSIRAVPTFAAEGTLREWVGVHTDVTDQLIADTALRELNVNLQQRVTAAVAERNVFADIFETTDAFVIVLDPQFCVLAMNQAAFNEQRSIFGKAVNVGEPLLELLADYPEQQAAARAVWQRALDGEEFTEIKTFGDPARETRTYEMKFNTLRDNDGRTVGAFQVVTNITQRVTDAARLTETQDALRQAQKMEAIGQLTGGVAHDFNNLLTIIRGGAEFLQRADLPANSRVFIDGIYDAADRATKLTQQLLAFSRRQPLRPTVFDVAERTVATAAMLQAIVGSRITLLVDCEQGLRVNADVAQFETALVNICVNARDAMQSEGLIDIQAVRSGANISISIKDNGEGIAPEIMQRLFEPFFTTKAVGEGTGLGLSQVFGFARQSGGDVSVTSEIGIGTCITLLLPATTAEIDEVQTAEAPAIRSARRVLVVEDNTELRKFATTLFNELGHSVASAASSDEALTLLNNAPDAFEVVFTDVVMAGMSGLDLAREIRMAWPNIRVVLTSGYSDALANAEGLDFPFVSKPYSADQVAAVLS